MTTPDIQQDELGIKIFQNVEELYVLAETIQMLDKHIVAYKDWNHPDCKDLLTEFWDVSARYKEVCNNCEILLGIYFKQEGDVKNMAFRKLYKSLTRKIALPHKPSA